MKEYKEKRDVLKIEIGEETLVSWTGGVAIWPKKALSRMTELINESQQRFQKRCVSRLL